MRPMQAKAFALETPVRAGDVDWIGHAAWEEIDDLAGALVGRPGLAIPTVRVGLCWVLDHLGYRRHQDHVLVPRFVGRCILNSVNRFALPVEEPTSRTRAVIAVDQFGLRQDMQAIAAECAARGYVTIEDAPCGVRTDEQPSEGSVARLIGFSKALPVTQGGFLVSADERLLAFVRAKRAVTNLWSWAAWLGVWSSRRLDSHAAGEYSALVNAAYELYPDAGGGAGWIRTNMKHVFGGIDDLMALHRTRLQKLRALRGAASLFPDTDRLAYVVPYVAQGEPAAAAAVLTAHGFSADRLHVDTARNLFAPEFVQAFLIPVNPRIPDASFDALVSSLHALEQEAGR
jgi:hypothetical protein